MISGNEIMFLRRMAGFKSQSALAKEIGVSRAAVKDWECDKYSPQGDNIVKLAKALRVKVEDLLQKPGMGKFGYFSKDAVLDIPPETEEEASIRHNNRRIAGVNDLLMVPMISPEVRVSAGCGNDYSNSNLEFTEVGKYPVFDGQLAALYSNDGLLSMIVDGDSMEPQIHDGDVIIFDHDSNWVSGCIYVVCLDGRMLVKGLIKENGDDAPLLRSSNKEYSDIHIKQGQGFTVYGRVLKIDTTRRPKPII